MKNNSLPYLHFSDFDVLIIGSEDAMEQRNLVYTLTDSVMENEIKNFISSRAEVGLSDSCLDNLFRTLNEYEKTGCIPDSAIYHGDLKMILPAVFILVTGSAGTGKTTFLERFMFQRENMTLTGTTNSASNNFLSELNLIGKPNGIKGSFLRNTIHKILNIDFKVEKNMNLFDRPDIHHSYKKISGAFDQVPSENDLIFHLKLVLQALHPLYLDCLSSFQKSFFTYKQHKYAILSSTRYKFDLDTKYYAKELEPVMNYKDITTQNIFQHFICDQSKTNRYKNANVSPLVIYNEFIIEEAGRMAALYTHLFTLLWWRINFMYNTPQLRQKKLALILSGSDTQSFAVNFPISMLDEFLNSKTLECTNDVLPIVSEFNRRQLNSHEDEISQLHKLLCTRLEKNIDMTPTCYNAMLFQEVFLNEVQDPYFLTNATRIFSKHITCSNYDKRLYNAQKATITVIDTLYVCSNIITVQKPVNNTIYKEHLSGLTIDSAQKNLCALWLNKKPLYFQDGHSVCGLMVNPKNKLSNIKSQINCGDFDTAFEKYIMDTFYQFQLDMFVQNKIDKKRKNVDVNKEILPVGKKKEEEEEENETNKKEETTIRYIAAPSKYILSTDAHAKHRLYIDDIEKKLQYSRDVSDAYFNSSRAANQTTEFKYAPEYDFSFHISDPCFDDDDDDLTKTLGENSTGFLSYLAFRRERHFIKDSLIVDCAHQTKGTTKGVSGTLYDIMISSVFSYTSFSFKICVYSQILQHFRLWLQNKDTSGTLENYVDASDITFDNISNLSISCGLPDNLVWLFHEYNLTINDFIKEEWPVSKIYYNLLRLINSITENPECDSFTNDVHLNVYVENDIFYSKLKYSVDNIVSLSSLHITTSSSLRVLGNGLHECCQKENERHLESKNVNFYKTTHTYWEKFHHQENSKYYTGILNDEVNRWFPELSIDTILVLLIDECLIFKTKSEINSSLPWVDIFAKAKSNGSYDGTFGVLMRREATPKAPIARSKLFHHLASRPVGELLNFPRPFQQKVYPYYSDIVVKTRDSYYYYAKNYRCLTPQIVNINTNEIGLSDNVIDDTVKDKKHEKLLLLPLFNHMLPTVAETVDAMQGRTLNRYVSDIGNMTLDKHLVTLTRGSNSHRIHLSGLSQAQSNVIKADHYKDTCQKRRHKHYYSKKYFLYR